MGLLGNGSEDQNIINSDGESLVKESNSEEINNSLNNVEEQTDQLESLQTTTNSKLESIKLNQTNGEQETRLVDEYGNDIEGTMLNQLKVAQNYRISGGIFNGSALDSNFYTSVVANNGTVPVANTEATPTTTIDANSKAGLYANSIGRYMGANMNYYRSVYRVGDTGAVNNKRTHGICDILPKNNGAFFQLSGTTFSCVVRKGGSDTVVSSGNFNGDVTTYALDTNYHTYEIYYTNKRIMFVIDGVVIHTFTATTTSLMGTMNLRPFLNNENTGVGSVTTCSATVMTISRYGTLNSQAKSFFQQGTTAGVLLKTGAGALHLLNISGVSNSSVVTLYDGISTSGILLWSSGTMGAQTQPFNLSFNGAGGTTFSNGLFLVISGANSNCFVKYE